MKRFSQNLVLVCLACVSLWGQAANSAQSTPSAPPGNTNSVPIIPLDENGRKAKSLVEQGIQALGGDTYLNIRDREMQGRGYGFHHGRPSGSGSVFWSFSQFPDKERVEVTKERDIAELYV